MLTVILEYRQPSAVFAISAVLGALPRTVLWMDSTFYCRNIDDMLRVVSVCSQRVTVFRTSVGLSITCWELCLFAVSVSLCSVHQLDYLWHVESCVCLQSACHCVPYISWTIYDMLRVVSVCSQRVTVFRTSVGLSMCETFPPLMPNVLQIVS